MTRAPATVAQTLARGIALLAKQTESARADAQIMLAYVLKRERAWLVSHAESYLTQGQTQEFESACEQRMRGAPVGYITGTAWFYGHEFFVDEHVLVPRPETEHMVDEAIEHLREVAESNVRKQLLTVLDVGVGSGAIACTIAREVAQAAVEGTESSAEALAVANHNAKRLNVHRRCRFVLGDLVEPLGHRRYEVVVANLPYVPTADVPPPPDPLGFEPRQALDGGPDGLSVYRRFVAQTPRLLKPGGLLLLEAAPPVMDGLLALVRTAFPQVEPRVGLDYGGRHRFIALVAPD